MILTFKAIDNHLQRQLLKLMKYAVNENESKRAIYTGYGVIRNHLIDIIDKIKDYYRYHDKLTSLYSINEMYIPGLKPRFIIPSLTDDIYGTLGEEIKTYLNGFDSLLGIDVNNYNVLNDIFYFKKHFASMCYNSIYYALKELGTSNFTGANLLIEALADKEKDFFKDQVVGLVDIDDIFNFNRWNPFLFGWNGYSNKYSLSHKAFKQLKKLERQEYAELYDDNINADEYDGLSVDGMFRKYVQEMLVEQDDMKKRLKKTFKEFTEDDVDKIEEDVESENESEDEDEEEKEKKTKKTQKRTQKKKDKKNDKKNDKKKVKKIVKKSKK